MDEGWGRGVWRGGWAGGRFDLRGGESINTSFSMEMQETEASYWMRVMGHHGMAARAMSNVG